MNKLLESMPKSLGVMAATLSIVFFTASIFATVHRGIINQYSHDDIHYLYYSASQTFDPDRHAQMSRKVSDFLNSDADTSHYPYRFDERQKVIGNYALLSQVMVWVRSSQQSKFSEGGASYPQALTTIFNVSLHITITVVLLILVTVLYIVRRDFLLGAALGLTGLLFLDRFYPWGDPLWILHVRPQNFLEFFERILQTIGLIFNAGGILSSFPRGNFLILTIAVFLLRWSGRFRASYVLLAVASFVHLATTALLVMCLLATDMLLRRKTLRSPVTLAISSGVIGWFLSGGLVLNAAIISSSLPPIAISLAIALFAFGMIRFLTTLDVFSIVDRVVEPIRNTGPIVSDFIILYAMWIALLPISIAMYFYVGEPWNLWTWGELPGRYLQMIRGPLLVGGAILFVNLLQRKRTRFEQTAALVTLVVAGGLFVYTLNLPYVFDINLSRLIEGIERREETMVRAEMGERFEYVEANIYYAIPRAIDLGRPFSYELLNFTAGACKRRQSACE